ncbi:PPOX class F420-dependent oxidoreductase [Kineosporiaceae bacterium SCSIO 59966]|nr:PPOX class F420-dependent oxidoreductase [Kineosporiaceae bacterium SCSIO 59966]
MTGRSEHALAFISRHHHAVMATTRADGRAAMSPVLATVDDEGRVLVSSRETAMKVRHLRRDPYASLCVFTDRFFGSWVQVEGDVEVLSLPEAMEPLVGYYRLAVGEHPDWDDYRAAMTSEQRVLLRMTVTRSGPAQQG